MLGKIKCLNCNTILELKDKFDFRSCGCSNKTFIHSGILCSRIGGIDLNKIDIMRYSIKDTKTKRNTYE